MVLSETLQNMQFNYKLRNFKGKTCIYKVNCKYSHDTSNLFYWKHQLSFLFFFSPHRHLTGVTVTNIYGYSLITFLNVFLIESQNRISWFQTWEDMSGKTRPTKIHILLLCDVELMAFCVCIDMVCILF